MLLTITSLSQTAARVLRDQFSQPPSPVSWMFFPSLLLHLHLVFLTRQYFSPSCSPELCGWLHPSWPRFVDYNEYERKSFERSCFQLHTVLAATALLRSLKSPASIQQDILAYQSRIDSVKHSTCGCLFRKLGFLPRPTLFLAGLLHLSPYGSVVLGCLRCLARCQKKSSWRVKIICRRAFNSAELSGGKTLFILPKDFGQYVMGK